MKQRFICQKPEAVMRSGGQMHLFLVLTLQTNIHDAGKASISNPTFLLISHYLEPQAEVGTCLGAIDLATRVYAL